MDKRKCAAKSCNLRVDKKFLMCATHWRMVPKQIQDDIYRTYRPKQEDNLAMVSVAYRGAMMAAVESVDKREVAPAVHV